MGALTVRQQRSLSISSRVRAPIVPIQGTDSRTRQEVPVEEGPQGSRTLEILGLYGSGAHLDVSERVSQSSQALGHARAIRLFEERKKLFPESVAEETRLPIAHVLPEPHPMPFRVTRHRLGWAPEQGAGQRRSDFRHAAGPAVPKQPKQDRLGLVSSMVGEEQPIEPFLLHGRLKRSMTGLPKGRFPGEHLL